MTQRAGASPSFGIASLHVFLLANVALALPLYDALGAHAHFFLAQGSEPVDVLSLVALLSFGVPALLVLCLGAVELVSPRARGVAHLIVVALGAGLYLLRVLNSTLTPDAWALVPSVVILGSVASLAYASSRTVQLFASLLSPAAIVIPVLFVFYSPVWRIALDQPLPLPNVLEADRDSSIVLVVFDELPTLSLLGPDEKIDGSRFPNFARLAQRSHWFRYASGGSDTTPTAVSAIATGRHGRKRTPAGYRSLPKTVFTMLRDSHEVNGWEFMTKLVPPSLHARQVLAGRTFGDRMRALLADVRVIYLHQVLPVDWRGGIPAVDRAWARWLELEAPGPAARRGKSWKSTPGRGQDFEDFIESIRPGMGPTLHFIHTMLPHTPWRHLPSGRTHASPQTRENEGEEHDSRKAWRDGPDRRIATYQQMHLLQTAYVDGLLGMLLDHLEEEGLFDEVMLIVTADHGKAFAIGEPSREPTAANHPEILFVPLFVKLPGQEAGVISDINAQNIDVVPTIADALGGIAPWPTDGTSLLSVARRPSSKHFLSYSTERTEYPMEAAVAAFRGLLERNVRRFSLSDRGHDLYRFGPFLDLIGTETARLPRRDEELGIRFELGGSEILVDSESEDIPDRVIGFLPRGHETQGWHVALSVNGVVAAVAETVGAEGRFDAFLPEALMSHGPNVLEVHRVERSSKGQVGLYGPPFVRIDRDSITRRPGETRLQRVR